MAPVSKDTSEDAPVKKRGLMGKLLRGVVYLLGAGALAAAGFAAGFVYFANPLSPEKGVLSLIEEAAPATEAPAEDHAAEHQTAALEPSPPGRLDCRHGRSQSAGSTGIPL